VYSSQEKIYSVGLANDRVGAQFNTVLSKYTKVFIQQKKMTLPNIAPKKYYTADVLFVGDKNYAL
jgi:hypothetical protein